MRLSFDRKVAGHFAEPGLDALIAPRSVVWIQLILATPAVLWGGWQFLRRGRASLVNRRLNMFTLIALGTGVAYFYSLVAALASRSKRSYWETSGASVPARRCRSTVSCSTGTAPSISR
jgi:Cu+-exporting ATPase